MTGVLRFEESLDRVGCTVVGPCFRYCSFVTAYFPRLYILRSQDFSAPSNFDREIKKLEERGDRNWKLRAI